MIATRSVRVADVALLIKRGIAPKYADDGDVVVLNQRCIRDNGVDLAVARRHDLKLKSVPEDRILSPGDCLVNSTGQGTLGRCAVLGSTPGAAPMTVDSHVTIVRPNQQLILPEFLGYCMGLAEQQLVESSTGSGGQTELSRESIGQVSISLPPLDEQKRIVAKLNQATAQCDQAIPNQERITSEAQTLESRRLAGMFSAAADEHTLQALSDVTDLDSGYAFPAAQFTTDPAAVPLLGGESIGHWAIKWASGKRWPEQASGDYGRYRLLAGDIVLAMDRPWVSTGLKVAVVDERHVPSLLIQRTARIRSRPNIDHDYLRFLLWAPQFSEYLLSVQTGVGVPHISLKQLGGFIVPVPDISIQRSMAEAAWAIHSHTFELIRTASALKEEIETLKDRYLTAMLTGSL